MNPSLCFQSPIAFSLTFFVAAFLASANSLAKPNSMDSYRWYLTPNHQEVRVDIDDLHSVTLRANPELDWGFDEVAKNQSHKTVKIALIDGGLDLDHPDIAEYVSYKDAECLDGQVIPPMEEATDSDGNELKGDCAGWDFVESDNRVQDEDGHGTHVAGLITRILKPHAAHIKLLPLRVFGPEESLAGKKDLPSLSHRLINAMEYAIQEKVDVIHLSVGWPKQHVNKRLNGLFAKAAQDGIAVIAAAGNSSQRANVWPCRMNSVTCVGALRADGQLAPFSNFGPHVDFLAPGEKILSPIPLTVVPLHISRKGYDFKNGTSQAAPFVTAAYAFLRMSLVNASREEILARLQISKSKFGLFNLTRALNATPQAQFKIHLKEKTDLVVSLNGQFESAWEIQNLWQENSQSPKTHMHCQNLSPVHTELTKVTNAKFQFKFKGFNPGKIASSQCELKIDSQSTPLELVFHQALPAPDLQVNLESPEQVVFPRITGAISRLMTIPTLHGQVPHPLFFTRDYKENKLRLYDKGRLIGELVSSKECQHLRIWQVDLNNDQIPDLLRESLCDKEYLYYEFLSKDFQTLYPSARYKPELSILNYTNFDIFLRNDLDQNAPPNFEFINIGFTPKSSDPWQESDNSRAPHLYRMQATQTSEGWSYQLEILESPKVWQKSLGLRYLPHYQVLHRVDDRLLIKIDQKTAWVDISTQEASWAPLNHMLWGGGKMQTTFNGDDYIFQLMTTPYNYRGYTLEGISLNYVQEDIFNPIMSVEGTRQTADGFQSVLRTIKGLLYLDYDRNGTPLSAKEIPVERFDFLAANELESVVTQSYLNQRLTHLVDGTRLSAQHLSLIENGRVQSLAVPDECASQVPVQIDGRLMLPLSCVGDVLRFYEFPRASRT